MIWLFPVFAFAIIAIASSKFSPKGTGVLSWHRLLPIYYLIFFVVIPVIEWAFGYKDFDLVPGVEYAYLVLSIGIFSFWLGGWTSFFILQNVRNFKLTERRPFVYLNGKSFVVMTYLVGLIAMMVTLFGGNFGLILSSGIESDGGAASNVVSTMASLVGVVLLISHWNFYKSNKNIKFWRIMTYFAFITMFLWGLFSNSKSAILTPIIYIAIISFMHGWRPSAGTLIAALAFVLFFVFPFVYLARGQLLVHASGMGRSEYIEFIASFILRGAWFDADLISLVASDAIGSLGRNLLTVLSTIVTETGSSVAFLHGETYRIGLGVSVPRFIWPDKPVLDIGNFIGHYYGLISSGDQLTNISPSQPGEMYMNYGIFAVAIGMSIWGVFGTLLYKIYGSHSWMTPALVLMITWQESHATSLFLWPRNLIFLICVLFFIRFIDLLLPKKNRQ